jgi:2,5-dihydroxypyridine 5,6-dioxygenase
MFDPAAADLVQLFRREFELCQVLPDENVVILADARSPQDYTRASMAALSEIGAGVVQLSLPNLPITAFTPDESADGLAAFGKLRLPIEMMRAADMVVDLTRAGLLYTGALKALREGSTRVLSIRAGEPTLRRLFPTEEVVRRARVGAKALDEASRIRLVSEAGTDLVMDKTGRPAMPQYGLAEAPGRWDNWGTGGVLAPALEDSAEGVLVIDEGDIALPLRRYTAQPIRCHFERGRITAIEGGVDAGLLREYFDMWNDDTVTRIAHIGWGTEHRSRWVNMAVNEFSDLTSDTRFFYGNVQIAVGRNYGIGGINKCLPHTDIVLRRCDFYLDGEQIVANGEIVPEALR